MKKATITVCIPAHNEERNIEYALRSVVRQKLKKFRLESIVVYLDGCIDGTLAKVQALSKKYRLIKVFIGVQRQGKAVTLNKLYRINKSDFLVTMDADVVFLGDSDLENLVGELNKNKSLNVVAAHEVPVKATGFIEKINVAGHRLWDEIRLSINGGNHIHNLRGSCSALRKSFAGSIKYPNDMSCDQGFLYISATLKKPKGFKYIKSSRILFRSPTTLYESRLLGTRSIFDDKKKVAIYFGNWVYDLYNIPATYKLRALIKMLLQDPIFTTLSVLLGIYIRMFPLNNRTKGGKWEMVISTKSGISESVGC